jgi:hypothetical protein
MLPRNAFSVNFQLRTRYPLSIPPGGISNERATNHLKPNQDDLLFLQQYVIDPLHHEENFLMMVDLERREISRRRAMRAK